MGGIVNVLGLPVNIMTENEMTGLMKSYLANDYMNIIYMVSVNTYNAIVGDVELIENMKVADLILPGERILMSSLHNHKVKGIVNSYKYILYMLRKPDMFERLYVIGENEKSTEALIELFKRQNSNLEICGSYSAGLGSNDEIVINDININEPDLLIISTGSPELEKWIHEHRAKIFVKLCVGIGDLTDSIIKENVPPPGWIVKLGLDKLYYDIKERKYSDNRKKERIMRALVADYNNTEDD